MFASPPSLQVYFKLRLPSLSRSKFTFRNTWCPPLPSCKGVLWDKLVTTSLSWQVYLEVCLLSQTLPLSKLTLDYVCHSHYSFALHECTLRYGYIPCAMFVVAIPPSLHDHLKVCLWFPLLYGYVYVVTIARDESQPWNVFPLLPSPPCYKVTLWRFCNCDKFT